ncbi:hypothetical protein [Symbiopectobacterium sp. RP]|uniref:hypothetical protein n=1 Tax=Symbiopectobacterium sp. RP TaxID=3248553 RepID=UPI003D2C54C7
MIWHDIQQNTEEWEALRVGKTTASNFGLIMAKQGKRLAILQSAMRSKLHWSKSKAASRNSAFQMSTWSVVTSRRR